MAIVTRLYLESEDTKGSIVLMFDLRFLQETEEGSNRPVTVPQHVAANLVVETVLTDTSIYEWMIHPTMKKNIKIESAAAAGTSGSRTYEFLDAYCVDYHETVSQYDSQPMVTKFSITARTIKLNGIEYKNNWPE